MPTIIGERAMRSRGEVPGNFRDSTGVSGSRRRRIRLGAGRRRAARVVEPRLHHIVEQLQDFGERLWGLEHRLEPLAGRRQVDGRGVFQHANDGRLRRAGRHDIRDGERVGSLGQNDVVLRTTEDVGQIGRLPPVRRGAPPSSGPSADANPGRPRSSPISAAGRSGSRRGGLPRRRAGSARRARPTETCHRTPTRPASR